MNKTKTILNSLTIIFIIIILGVNNITNIVFCRKLITIIFAYLAMSAVFTNLAISIKQRMA